MTNSRKLTFVLRIVALCTVVAAGWFVLSSSPAKAANPSTINFQGKVVNSDGTNVANGSYTFIFRLYDTVSPTTTGTCASNSSCWWEETDSITVTNGVFQVELGAGCAFTSACSSSHSGIDFNTNNALYLTMKFNSDAAGFMSPTIHLTTTPYAFNADKLGGLSSSAFAQLSAANAFTNTNSIAVTSATAFQLQNASGSQILNFDTTTDSNNLITNGGFETNTTGWAAIGSSTLTRITTQQQTGNASLQVDTTTAAGGDGIKYNFALAGSTTYAFSFYAQASGSQFSTFDFGYSGDGSTNTTCTTNSPSGTTVNTGGWRSFTCTFTTGSVSGTRYVYIKQTDTTARTFYIDSAYLRATSNQSFAYNDARVTLDALVTSPLNIQPATNTMNAFSVTTNAGSAVLSVDTLNGRVGIGGGTPGAKLQITNTTNSQTLTISSTGSGTLFLANETGSGSIAELQNNGTDVLKVDNAGLTTVTGAAIAGVSSGNGTDAGVVLTVTGATGGASSATTGVTGGAGSGISLVTGTGGAVTGASGANTGGAGGVLTLQASGGGNATSGNGGAGGNIQITAGNAGTGGNANGGTITLKAGSATGSGTIGNVLVKNASDSSTAFQIQNAAGTETVFNVDTTARGASGGNLVKIGNSTGTDTALTILQVDSSAGVPTSNLSALNGGIFYDSSAGHLKIIEGGAVKTVCNLTDNGCGTGGAITLSTAYTNSIGGATPEIKLDVTRKAFDVQDADTTIGATEGLLNVRGANGSGLGASLFVVQGNGRVGINNGSTATSPAVSYDLSFGQGADRTIGVETQATTATGGNGLTVSAGTGNTSGGGGALNLQGGAGGSSGAGGAVTVQGGTGNSAAGGAVNIYGGSGSSIGAINIGTNGTTTITAGTNSGTLNVVSGTVNFQKSGGGAGLGPNINFQEAENGVVTITSNLTQANRSTAALYITQANDATNSASGNLVKIENLDADSGQSGGNDIVQISNSCSSGCGSALNITQAQGSGITFTGSANNLSVAINASNVITTGTILQATGLTSGQEVKFSWIAGATSSSIIESTNSAANVTADYTGALINIQPTRTMTATATRADSGNFLNLNRSYTLNNTSNIATLNLSGALATLQSNCTVSDGGAGGADVCNDSANILALNQANSGATGTVLSVTGAGSGNLADFKNATATLLSVNSTGNVSFASATSGGQATHTISVATQAQSATAGDKLTISAGTSNGATAGGQLTLQGGAASATAGSNGGAVQISGGASTSTGTGGNGGSISINGGDSNGSGTHNGGNVTIQGGASNTASASTGGTVTIQGGTNNVNGGTFGGTVNIIGGSDAGTGGTTGGTVAIQGGSGNTPGTVTIDSGGTAGSISLGSLYLGESINIGVATSSTNIKGTTHFIGNNVNVATIDSIPTANNLLTNVSVESSANIGNAGDWQKRGGSETTFAQDSTNYYSGSNSLKITTTAAAGDGAKQNVTLTNGTVYTLTFYALLDSASASTPTLVAGYAYNGSDITTLISPSWTPTSSGWTKFSWTFTQNQTNSSTPYIFIKQSTSTIATFYIDAVTLQTDANNTNNYREGSLNLNGAVINSPVILENTANSTQAFQVQNASGSPVLTVDTTDSNLITNPGAEVTTSGWSGKNSGTVIRDTSQANFGYASFKIGTTTSANSGAQYTFATSPGSGQMSIGLSAKFSSGTAFTANSLVAGIDDGAANADNSCTLSPAISSTVPTSTGWTRFTCTLAAGSVNATKFFIKQTDAPASGRTFWVDGIELDSGATLTPYGVGGLSFNGIVKAPLTLQSQSATTAAFQLFDTSGNQLVGVDTLNATLSLGSTGSQALASTINIANSTGAATQTINIGATNSASNAVLIQGGTGASAIQLLTGTSGTISIGTINNSDTITIGSTALSTGTQAINIGASNTAGGTVNVAIGCGATCTGGTTTVTSKGALTITGNAASTWSVAGAALTLTAGAASTWSSSAGSLTVQAATTNTLNLQTGGAGTVAIGNANTTTINIGTNNLAHTIGIGSAATSTAQTITIGSSGSSAATTIALKAGSSSTTAGPSTTLGATASTAAVCSALANGAAPAANTTYELRDCSGAPALDYAEYYPTAGDANYGDVMVLGTNTVSEYTTDGYDNVQYDQPMVSVTQLVKSQSPYTQNVIGIVSNNHGDFTSTGNHVIRDTDHPMPIALNGRVPVNIASDSAPIQPGDYLTTSDQPGKAMKATGAGEVIGKALAAWNPGSGATQIIVFVEQGYYPGPTLNSYIQNGGDATLATIDVTTANISDLNVSGAVTVNNLTVLGSASIAQLTVTGSITTSTIRITDRLQLGSNNEDPESEAAHPITKRFKASLPMPAGTAVILDSNAGWVTTTSKANDSRVVGVTVEDASTTGDIIEVAIGGTARVSVHGSISVGQLVGTSTTIGDVQSMNIAVPGSVVGKVLAPADSNGQILILVTLE